MKLSHIQHLYNRIDFGITPKKRKHLSKKSKKHVVNALFKSSYKTSPLSVDTSFLKGITSKDYKDKTKRMELQKVSRKKVFEFSRAWFHRLNNPAEILREKMTLFWTNHFVCERKISKVKFI